MATSSTPKWLRHSSSRESTAEDSGLNVAASHQNLDVSGLRSAICSTIKPGVSEPQINVKTKRPDSKIRPSLGQTFLSVRISFGHNERQAGMPVLLRSG